MSRKLIIHHLSFIIRKSKGFTLVELLASVIVLVAIGSVIAGIVSSSLRGTNKTNSIENIRQNGNYALNQMSKDIEYALPFDGKNTGLSNDIEENTIYDTSCLFALSPTPTPATPYKFITVQSVNNIITRYKCSTSDSELSAEGISPVKTKTSLIDTASISLVSCSFTCIQNKATDIPIIRIKFELGPSSLNKLAESSGSITFETSVTMRNYKK